MSIRPSKSQKTLQRRVEESSFTVNLPKSPSMYTPEHSNPYAGTMERVYYQLVAANYICVAGKERSGILVEAEMLRTRSGTRIERVSI